MQVSDEHFRGRSVIAADGQAVGEVDALLIDTAAGDFLALQTKLHRVIADQLGAARQILRASTLELPVRMVQSAGDAVLLSLPTQELRQIFPDATGQDEEKT
jgi:sporulation protein YlmC with PRC-barrel domain